MEQPNYQGFEEQIKGSVRDRMERTGLLEHIGIDHLYASSVAPVEVLPDPRSSR